MTLYAKGKTSLGSNSRCRAERSRRQLGWRPNMGTEALWESIESDVVAFLKGYEMEG
jgi:hypothetical protein